MNRPSESKYLTGKLTLAVAVLAIGAGRAQAQSADALIDKLVDKGILTAAEAQDLRDESDKNFTTAFQTKMGMPDWVSGYKLSGDIRGRFEQYSSDNPAMSERVRMRYRLRVGLTVSMFDNLEAGFRLGSGDAPNNNYSAGNPLSQSSTFQDNFSDKSIYIDTAYGKWSPIHSGGWSLSGTIGKMDNPFNFTPMVFDQDLTPEGAAIQTGWVINDKHSLSLCGAAFVLDEEASATRDPFLYGGQLLWNANWTPKLSSTLGFGGFQLKSPEQLTTANVPFINRGNTREPFIPLIPAGAPTTYVLANNYTPVIADASLTYTLDSFPFYNGAFPIKWTGEYIRNLDVAKNNDGFWLGFKFGKSGTRRTWDIEYRYEFLTSDAWYDQLVDDDNVAFYPGDLPGASSTYGLYGGTNIKGHRIIFNYSFTDSLTFTATCYINSLINLNGVIPDYYVHDQKTSQAVHVMADMMWKF